MARAALTFALVIAASACGNKRDSARTGEPTGSAATATVADDASGPHGVDPWDKPVDVAPCDDDDLRAHIQTGLASSAAYLTALEKRTARWKKDCAAATRDLLALEPDATAFVSAMMAFKAWGEALSPACRARVEELGEQSAMTAELEKRTPMIEQRVAPMLERCKDHPGFAEAANKGLRVLRKKS